jgi:VanZ family protein
MAFSGDLGSAARTRELIDWLLSWLPFLGESAAEGHGHLRKAGHVAAYAVLYLLWFRAFRQRLAAGLGGVFCWPLLLCLAIACADEGHQALTPSRSGSLVDVALDFSAAALTALALLWKRIYLNF